MVYVLFGTSCARGGPKMICGTFGEDYIVEKEKYSCFMSFS